MSAPEFQVVTGDSLEILKLLRDDSVDAMVTDPPAGIGFMGREWDSDKGGRVSWIAWLESVAREALRAMKPGAHGVVWALPRTSHWTATALEQAGFEIRDVINHHFGTGFPKSLNVSKAIDQARVEDQEPIRAVCRFLRAKMDLHGIKSSQLTEFFGNCDPRLIDHWAARDTDSQPNLPTLEQWARLKEILELADDMDAEVERLNTRKGERGDTYKNATVIAEIAAPAAGGVTTNFLKSDDPDRSIREESAAAAAWHGWGTALKPASEHWILVRKPLSGTVAANVQEHGTGALNIDATRIDGRERTDYGVADSTRTQGVTFGTPSESADFDATKGRWPANLVLSHSEWCDESGCLPGCPVALLDAQSLAGGMHGAGVARNKIVSGDVRAPTSYDMSGAHNMRRLGDSGGASRFFYISKPSTKEREDGLAHLPKKSGGEIVDRAEDSAGINNPRAGAGRTAKGRANFHPTVKSIGLMSWLVKLISPQGGVVLDPFCGSGSTGVAALLGGWNFLGIEKDPEYAVIANARIAHAAASVTTETKAA